MPSLTLSSRRSRPASSTTSSSEAVHDLLEVAHGLEVGADGVRWVSAQLGRSDPAFTLRVYAHVLPDVRVSGREVAWRRRSRRRSRVIRNSYEALASPRGCSLDRKPRPVQGDRRSGDRVGSGAGAPDALGVRVGATGVGHRQDRCPDAPVRGDHGVAQVACERRDPASARGVGSDEGNRQVRGAATPVSGSPHLRRISSQASGLRRDRQGPIPSGSAPTW